MAQLAMRWHTPLRLMKFLDDARERNVLRRSRRRSGPRSNGPLRSTLHFHGVSAEDIAATLRHRDQLR
jgi:SOS response regulatory protein OraA/RecX